MLVGPLITVFALVGLVGLIPSWAWPGPHQVLGSTEPLEPNQTEVTPSDQASPTASDAPAPPELALVTKPTKAYSYPRMMRELRQLAAMYPGLITLSIIGKTVAGLKIPLVTLGTGPREILVLGSEHARGVDINRNYPSNWLSNKLPKRPDYQLYKGKRAALEPETRAVIKLAKAHEFEYMLTMHTYGQVIYYRDRTGYVSPHALPLAKRTKKVLGYWLVQPKSSLGRASTGGGASAGWFRQTFRRPALTIELTPNWEPFARAPRDFYTQIWPRGQALFLKLL